MRRLSIEDNQCPFGDQELFDNDQRMTDSQKDDFPLFRHSGLDPESSHHKQFRTPAPVPDRDPGFAGVTISCEAVEVVQMLMASVGAGACPEIRAFWQ